jgi:hypothetical protein
MSDRSTHTDAVATLGTIIDETQRRDAIHLATEPVIAAEKLFPGQDVGLVNGKATHRAEKLVGIVDPFLKGPVFAGQRFWLIVYPRQITTLLHTWEHPDFPSGTQPAVVVQQEAPQTSELLQAIDYVVQIAAAEGITYEQLMGSARDYPGDEELYVYGGDVSRDVTVTEEFWENYSKIVGYEVELYVSDDGCRGC